MRSAARVAVASCAVLAAAGASAPASAQTVPYTAHPFVQSPATSLEVSGPLSEFRAGTRARVTVPSDWRRERVSGGRLRFLTPGSGCRYRVTFSVITSRAPEGDALTRLDALLPVPRANRLLDQGQRGRTAFRVIRPVRQDGRVELRGLRTGLLTRRADIAGAGQVAWSDLSVTAVSRPGDECHSGTYRERMGPQIGDALATARTTLKFVRAPS
jgi:hypothetical protein